ncbi:hypothetical protein ACSSV9_12205 [Melioribacter sp. OK-6-Me]|uniref:hypothetical protein n=1 Tax=Melioribacter sp. OK-6-Me TaxID=3423433 RepID=UPI003ED9E4A0
MPLQKYKNYFYAQLCIIINYRLVLKILLYISQEFNFSRYANLRESNSVYFLQEFLSTGKLILLNGSPDGRFSRTDSIM